MNLNLCFLVFHIPYHNQHHITHPFNPFQTKSHTLLSWLIGNNAPASYNNNEMLNAYIKACPIFTATSWIVDACNDIDFVIKDIKKDEFIYDHPILKLLKNPNPFTNSDEFKKTIFNYFLLTGNIYLNLSNQTQYPYNISKIANFIEIDNIPSTTGIGGLFYNGVIYSNINAPYIGINTIPDQRYSLSVSGKIKSFDGYFTPDDHKLITWYDSSYLLPNGDI